MVRRGDPLALVREKAGHILDLKLNSTIRHSSDRMLLMLGAAMSFGFLASCSASQGREENRPRPVDKDTSTHYRTQLAVDSTGVAGQVSGTVVDAHSGEAVASAHVIVRYPASSAMAAIADDEGRFTLSLPPGDTAVIEAARIGYKYVQITIDTRTAVVVKIALAVNPYLVPADCKAARKQHIICL